jgi:hypothetical protein
MIMSSEVETAVLNPSQIRVPAKTETSAFAGSRNLAIKDAEEANETIFSLEETKTVTLTMSPGRAKLDVNEYKASRFERVDSPTRDNDADSANDAYSKPA